MAQCIWNSLSWLNFDVLSRAVDKPKFMDRPPADHQWWKTGLPKSFLACPKFIWLIFIWNSFLVINTNFACFPFNHIPSYRELGRPSVDCEGHVGSPDRVMDRIWRLGDRLSTDCTAPFVLRPMEIWALCLHNPVGLNQIIQAGFRSWPRFCCDALMFLNRLLPVVTFEQLFLSVLFVVGFVSPTYT